MQFFRPRGEFRPGGVGACQIRRLQREFFETDKMQAVKRGIGMGGAKRVKSLPERKKIQPGAKAGFRYGEQRLRVVCEARRQLISGQKDVTRFFQTVVIGKVNVIKISGNRCTLIIEVEGSGFDGGMFHVSYSSDRQWHDLSDVSPAAQIYRQIV